MENKLKRWKTGNNLLKHLQCREINSKSNTVLKEKFQFCNSFVERLGLEAELNGHLGCVNCLEWTPNGMYLASGSDDTSIILWDTFGHKLLKSIPTPHRGNIFSVKFLADENIIATAAGDYHVIVQNVDGAINGTSPLLDCMCHVGRVKRLATCPDQPTLFWSAGEDGLVLQYDMREPHECFSNNKVLVNLHSVSEIKCIAVNPTKPQYVAVGANDCFVRLYDRRMIKITKGTNLDSPFPMESPDPETVQYYSPGHLVKTYSDVNDCKLAVTYVAFNQAGSEMLANVGGEQIYLFDVNNSRHINEIQVSQYLPKSYYSDQTCTHCDRSNDFSKISANSNENCYCFYMTRAFRSFNRQWVSDVYCAARDYLHVIQHWPDHTEAYIGIIKCLIRLNWVIEANDWLQYFLTKFPESTKNVQIKFLLKDLESIKRTSNTNDQQNRLIDADYVKKVSEDEKKLRLNSFDFETRFLGHCNTTTDIKEANFLGENGNYICAGSDEGIIFIWDKKTTEVVRALVGDISIVNCIQPHPSACFLASSGIDPVVKLWSPMPEYGVTNTRVVNDIPTIMKANQQRMFMDPFQSMLANIGYRVQEDDVPTCRTS